MAQDAGIPAPPSGTIVVAGSIPPPPSGTIVKPEPSVADLNPTFKVGAPSTQPMQDTPSHAGKLTGLPGVNPHTPSLSEGLQDTALAASPLMMPVGEDAVAFAQTEAGKDLIKRALKHTGEKLLAGAGIGVGYGAIHQAAKLLGLAQ